MGGYTATEARQRWKAAQARVAFDYDEAKHPRDEHGRWGAGGQVWEASGKPSYWQTPTEMRAEIDQFDRLPADTQVRLFHGTTADNADGIVATKRAGYEPRADTVSTGSQHHGLYVAPTFDDAKSYAGPGGKVVEMVVARGDVVPSPEARNKTVGEALYHSFEGAVLRDGAKIDPVAVHDPVRARAARLSARARVAFGEWNEADHPRGEHGRFGEGGSSDKADGAGTSRPFGPEMPANWREILLPPRGPYPEVTPAMRAASDRYIGELVDSVAAAAAERPGGDVYADRLRTVFDRFMTDRDNGGSERYGTAHPLGPDEIGEQYAKDHGDVLEFGNALTDAAVFARIPEPAGWKPVVTAEEAAKLDGGLGIMSHVTDAAYAIRTEGFKLPEYTANLSLEGRGTYTLAAGLDPSGLSKFGGTTFQVVSRGNVDDYIPKPTYELGRPNTPAEERADFLHAIVDVAGGVSNALGENLQAIEDGKVGRVTLNGVITFNPRLLSVIE